jgi:hypothetical protein
MIYPFFRLSEAGADNLGLACTDDGLLLGDTSLIERVTQRAAKEDQTKTFYEWVQAQPYSVQRAEGLRILRDLGILK